MYHIVKNSRIYNGFGYTGPTCKKAGTKPGHQYKSIRTVQKAINKLNKFNPVGFYAIYIDIICTHF